MGRRWDLHFQCDFDLEISTRYFGRLGLFSVTLDFSQHARNIWRAFFGVHTLSMLKKYAKSRPPSLHYQVFGSACYSTLLLKMWRCSWDVHIWAPQYLKHLKWPGVHLISLRCDIQRSRVRRWKFGIPLFRAGGQKAKSSRSRQEVDTVTKIGLDNREMPASASSSSLFITRVRSHRYFSVIFALSFALFFALYFAICKYLRLFLR